MSLDSGGCCNDKLPDNALDLFRFFVDGGAEASAVNNERVAQKLCDVDMSLLDDHLCFMLLEICRNNLQSTYDISLCTSSLVIILHMIENEGLRGLVAAECNLLSIVFNNEMALTDTRYLSAAFDMVWLIMHWHTTPGGGETDMCDGCKVLSCRCLCHPLTGGQQGASGGDDLVVGSLFACLNLVMLQSLEAELLCRAWAVSCLLLGQLNTYMALPSRGLLG